MQFRPIAVVAAFLMLTANAYAAPIPAPVEDMIRAAGPGQTDTQALFMIFRKGF